MHPPRPARRDTMRPLFIIGNKRSGTSQLVRMLNLHPQIFVSHESDVAWILYQFHRSQPFCAHPWDSDRGMHLTLEAAQHLLRTDVDPMENFIAVQTAVMQKGNPWQSPQTKTDLQWMGDKKPMQHADPEVLAFLLQHFPEAHFLHIVRHPFEVVASSNRFNQTVNGDFWLGLSPEQKMEQWVFHEQQVLRLCETLPGRVHSLRYEDFCRQTEKELSRVFEFLKLDANPQVLRQAARQTGFKSHAVPAVKCSVEAMRIAAGYDYDLGHQPGPLKVWMRNVYWRTRKKLRV
jgi:hypothetical protein